MNGIVWKILREEKGVLESFLIGKKAMGSRMGNIDDHLKALIQQENAVDYQVEDYLFSGGRKARESSSGSDSVMQIDDYDEDSLYDADKEGVASRAWALTAYGRWQIGQWFYRSTQALICCAAIACALASLSLSQ